MGMRVNLTLLALAHLSMMSRDASWIGFFMYPTLISFSWAAAGAAAPSEMPIASARAAALSSSTRPLTLSRIDMGVLLDIPRGSGVEAPLSFFGGGLLGRAC